MTEETGDTALVEEGWPGEVCVLHDNVVTLGSYDGKMNLNQLKV